MPGRMSIMVWVLHRGIERGSPAPQPVTVTPSTGAVGNNSVMEEVVPRRNPVLLPAHCPIPGRLFLR